MPEPRQPSPFALVATVCLPAILAPLNSTMVAVALPDAAAALEVDSSAVRKGLVTSYLITSIVLQSPGGKLGDRLGHSRTLALGQLVFAVGAVLAYALPSLSLLTLSRVLMATGGAILVPSAMALLRTKLPPDKRGRAFGAFGSMMALSAATGPKIGALLVTHFGWESIFIANLPVLAVAFVLSRLVVGSPPAAESAAPGRFDVLGSVLLGAALLCIVLGSEGPPGPLLALGVFVLVPFFLWERRAADPVVDFALFRSPAFVGGGLVIALHNLAMYSLIFELPQVASRLFAISASNIGSVLFAMMATMVVVSPLAGRASERFGARPMAFLGSLVALAGMVLLARRPFGALDEATVPLVLMGFGLGAAQAPAQVAAIGAVPRERSGMASGVLSTLRYLGAVVGLAALDRVLSEGMSADVVQREHRLALTIFSVSLACALVASLMLKERPKPRAAAGDAAR